ncbi:MAG: permease [Planctomycetaceae bacterium]
MAIVWGIVLRIVQAFLQGAPFILTGLCIAAVFDRLLGQAHTRRLFGSNSLASLVQSWLIGMLLPGCSLGVIPVCRRLRASGIAVGTIFAFALSSPLFDPLSLLYGLTLSKPLMILAFAACSLAVVTASGWLFDRIFPDAVAPLDEAPPPPRGSSGCSPSSWRWRAKRSVRVPRSSASDCSASACWPPCSRPVRCRPSSPTTTPRRRC